MISDCDIPGKGRGQTYRLPPEPRPARVLSWAELWPGLPPRLLHPALLARAELGLPHPGTDNLRPRGQRRHHSLHQLKQTEKCNQLDGVELETFEGAGEED